MVFCSKAEKEYYTHAQFWLPVLFCSGIERAQCSGAPILQQMHEQSFKEKLHGTKW